MQPGFEQRLMSELGLFLLHHSERKSHSTFMSSPWLTDKYSVVSDSTSPRTVACQALLSMGVFPSKDTGVGCRFLLRGIFLIQGSNPGLLYWQTGSLPSEPQGKSSDSNLHYPNSMSNTASKTENELDSAFRHVWMESPVFVEWSRYFCECSTNMLFPDLLFTLWLTGALWMVEEDSEVLLDVGGYLHNAGAYLYIHISVWKLPRLVAKHDWTEKSK